MINTKEEFKAFVEDIQSQSWYKKPIGFAIGRVDRGQIDSSKILQVTFPIINWNENYGSAAVFLNALKKSNVDIELNNKSELVANINQVFIDECLKVFNPYISEAKGDDHKNTQVINTISSLLKQSNELSFEHFKIVFIFEDFQPQSVECVYLKLYALSLGKVQLRSLDLNGAFGLLHNCAWVGNIPIELDWLRQNEMQMKLSGTYPKIDMVDKFPRFLSHIIPADNTRILDTSKVRFGAQLAGGTTVMPGASYINFNAGTKGAVMVEGRISSSAVVGNGSDIGGGASILGVLSGTDGIPVSVGENTLLGVNSCIGVAIGDGCILDAGVTILAGTKITLRQKDVEDISKANPNKEIKTLMKGSDFIGLNGVHFRQNSINGQIIAKRSTKEIKLNSDLH